jgi:hypothetical protein
VVIFEGVIFDQQSLFLQLFYILKGNSLKLSKLAYCYHTKNRISLRQFDRTILTELLPFTNISPKCCIRKYTLQNYACLPFTIRIFAWQFSRSISEEVISLFDLEKYCIKMIVIAIPPTF